MTWRFIDRPTDLTLVAGIREAVPLRPVANPDFRPRPRAVVSQRDTVHEHDAGRMLKNAVDMADGYNAPDLPSAISRFAVRRLFSRVC
jgi:hypothetical protein